MDEILQQLDEAPPRLDEARTLYRTLYQSKNQLADFHVEPQETPEWAKLNERIDQITSMLATTLKT